MSQGFTNENGIPLPLSVSNGGTGTSGTAIKDANDNIILGYNSAVNAVNYVTVANAALGNSIGFYAIGADPNISWNFYAKGTGAFNFLASATAPTVMNYYEQTTNGTNYISVVTPASIASNQTVTWKSASSGYPALDTTDSDAWTDFSGSVSYTGFSVNPPTSIAVYKKIGKTCFVKLVTGVGTSNATTFTITGLPFSAAAGSWIPLSFVSNNSANAVGAASISGTTMTLYLGTGIAVSGWTAANNKGATLNFFYETT